MSKLLILFCVTLIVSAVGFRRFVWFISIGYGFSVVGVGVALSVLALTGAIPAGLSQALLCLLMIVYGLRLGLFLLRRELKSADYRASLKQSDAPSLAKQLAVWLGVAALYVAQTSPVFFALLNGARQTALGWLGVLLAACGIGLEALADHQKSVQKKLHPAQPAMSGLYRLVRCPNYLGELLFWTALYLSALDVLSGAWQWVIASVGYACIVGIMFNSASMLERKQMKRYGGSAAYAAYADRTPILLPFVPLYHLNPQPSKQVGA